MSDGKTEVGDGLYMTIKEPKASLDFSIKDGKAILTGDLDLCLAEIESGLQQGGAVSMAAWFASVLRDNGLIVVQPTPTGPDSLKWPEGYPQGTQFIVDPDAPGGVRRSVPDSEA